jgi:DnaK suppressor protein
MRKMPKKTREKFKKLYLKMRADIVSSINNADNELDLAGDDIDQVQGKTLSEMQDRLSKRDLAKLNRLDTALRKIDDGSFGICDDCGCRIPDKRLEILPGADLCINCAEQEETHLKAYATG